MIPRAPKPQILYEDVHVIVLAKPAGLLSQGDHSGDTSLVDHLREYLGRPYVGLVHRLDRNTSGLMVIGKRTKSADRLSQTLREGKLCRHYVAWVRGAHPGPKSRWQDKLLKDEKTNEVRVHKDGKPCSLFSWRERLVPRSRFGTISRVRFELETGMSHQIRVQSAARGLPLIGDSKYGGPPYKRIALHSTYLAFPHPMGDQWMEFYCGVPDVLKESAFLDDQSGGP